MRGQECGECKADHSEECLRGTSIINDERVREGKDERNESKDICVGNSILFYSLTKQAGERVR